MRGITRSAVLVGLLALGASAFAAPRERVPRERENPIVKMVKVIVKSLGDGLTIPGGKP
jgi:hypothetical protein